MLDLKKPKIFLGDLVHNYFAYNYCVPLNIGYLAATLGQRFGDAIDVRLFKFPDDIIEALEEGPDILALSNYDWNINLNKAIIRLAKERNPNVFVVMGGPNIRLGEDGSRHFLSANPQVDAYVLYEGEEAFANIVEHLLGHEGGLHRSLIGAGAVLPQVAYLANGREDLVFGPLLPSARDKEIKHPSPWLGGYLDPYLNCESFPLSPIIESTRGCPYSCTYCTAWGTAATGIKFIRKFPMETVLEELEYVFRKAEREFYLIIGDANIGILDRDVELVEKICELHEKYGKVTQVGIDTSKNNLQRNAEIYRILGGLSIPTFALQTFNDDVSVNIGRKNVSFDQTKSLVETVHAHGNQISTDLLVGLPSESKQGHIDSLKAAFDAGFDKFQIGDIRLLLGTEMETDDHRDKYGIRTKYRIIPSSFGVYGGERVIEYENCIRETAAMSAQDFLELRLLHGHVFLMLNLEIGRPLLDLGEHHGLHPVDLISAMSDMPDEAAYPRLFRQFNAYLEQSAQEWFDTQQEANAYYMQDEVFERICREGFPKLNYDYASRLIVDDQLRLEFLRYTGAFIKERVPSLDSTVVDEIVEFSNQRVLPYPAEPGVRMMAMSAEAVSEASRYLGPLPAENTGRVCRVELVAEQAQVSTIESTVTGIKTAHEPRHAVQLAIQFHNKLFVREARFAGCEDAVAAGE